MVSCGEDRLEKLVDWLDLDLSCRTKLLRNYIAPTASAPVSLRMGRGLNVGIPFVRSVMAEPLQTPTIAHPGAPLRLIDVKQSLQRNAVILCSYESAERMPYAAISHTWSKEMRRLSREAVRTRLEAPWPEGRERYGQALSRITCGLAPSISTLLWDAALSGFEYIWIDSLCLNQADSGEVVKQMGVMAAIYAQAEAVLVYTNPIGEVQHILLPDGQVGRWFDRAWTLQETIFAGRVRLMVSMGLVELVGPALEASLWMGKGTLLPLQPSTYVSSKSSAPVKPADWYLWLRNMALCRISALPTGPELHDKLSVLARSMAFTNQMIASLGGPQHHLNDMIIKVSDRKCEFLVDKVNCMLAFLPALTQGFDRSTSIREALHEAASHLPKETIAFLCCCPINAAGTLRRPLWTPDLLDRQTLATCYKRPLVERAEVNPDGSITLQLPPYIRALSGTLEVEMRLCKDILQGSPSSVSSSAHELEPFESGWYVTYNLVVGHVDFMPQCKSVKYQGFTLVRGRPLADGLMALPDVASPRFPGDEVCGRLDPAWLRGLALNGCNEHIFSVELLPLRFNDDANGDGNSFWCHCLLVMGGSQGRSQKLGIARIPTLAYCELVQGLHLESTRTWKIYGSC